ncbi:MAG: trigger factor, partial [candidate division NC10 bacterium]|nr:trigger factor [candidate division NC10 bacterium]
LRDQLKARKTLDQEAELKHALLEKLAAAHEVEAPESLVEVEASSLLREMLGTVRASGGRVEGLPENAEGLTAKALEVARRRVKESPLLEAVARQEALTVSQEEIEAEIQALAAAYRQEAAAVRRALEDPVRRAGLTARLLERKALDFLYQHATITEAFNLITPG